MSEQSGVRIESNLGVEQRELLTYVAFMALVRRHGGDMVVTREELNAATDYQLVLMITPEGMRLVTTDAGMPMEGMAN